MPARENPTIAALRRVIDPVDRAAACQEFIRNGRETLRAAQSLRDEAIRAARASDHPEGRTIDGLAGRIKAKRNVVVDALRGTRG